MDGQMSDLMAGIGAAARAAAAELAYAGAERKYAALISAAHFVWERRQEILDANSIDLGAAAEKGLSPALTDRLMLNEHRIRGMVDGLRTVAEAADPVGRVLAEWDRPNGLHIQRVATPAQCHRRCRCPVPEGRECGDPAWRVGKFRDIGGDP
jgi:glutamate-5-semialdehyde dehydrogenase